MFKALWPVAVTFWAEVLNNLFLVLQRVFNLYLRPFQKATCERRKNVSSGKGPKVKQFRASAQLQLFHPRYFGGSS